MDENKYRGSLVKVIGISDTGEKIPAASGRISTQPGNASAILEKSLDPQKNAKLISKVTKSGHNSTIEHTVFNLAFQDVSVFCEQFIIEFRLASFTVKSRRYVDFGSDGYYVPFIGDKYEEEFKKTMDSFYDDYNYFVEKGIPKEDARFVLPYCLKSNFFCTVNARELLHMIQAMLFGRGSAFIELKNLGEQIFEQIEKLTPGICTDFFARRPKLSDKINIGLRFDDMKKAESADKKVQLLSYTLDAQKTIARTALVESRQYTADTIENIVSDETNVKKIIDIVMDSSRPRPLETASYTFRINGVSLSTITHFTRHRMQSLSIPSLTLTDRTKYIIPDTVRANPEFLKRYTDAFSRINELINHLRHEGLDEELLVYCQLSGNTLDIVSTMNARELKVFFSLRTCSRAQWEIRKYAHDMLMELRRIDPYLFEKFGPSCFMASCPEGAFSCGKAAEIKEYYGKKDE